MHKACTLSALMAGHIASHHLASKGLLVFTGAKAVYMGPTPGMIGYHLAKTATHAIAQNMATREDLPEDSTVITILPDVLDTPMNREAMPDADHSKWAKCSQVASLIKMWAHGENLPENGSFILMEAENGSVSTKFV
jgi:dihydropteridine reductase